MPSLTASPAAAAAAPQKAKQDGSTSSPAVPSIIDIRGEIVEMNLKEEIAASFNPDDGPRRLPTLLLYNEKGLQIFEDVCCFCQDFSDIFSQNSRSHIWMSIT